MNAENFQKLIQQITGRELIIDTDDIEILPGKEYRVYRPLKFSGGSSSFKWKAATTDEKLLRSFITAFTTKYREPNPDSYNYTYGGKVYTWEERTPEEREFAYFHHASHMYSKEMLLKQVEDNFNLPEMQAALIRYGFYSTNYGIGIFCYFETQYVRAAIETMKQHLSRLSIPFNNEYSDARWVLRFKLGLTKEQHTAMLAGFNS